jgi:hypothetical protein
MKVQQQDLTARLGALLLILRGRALTIAGTPKPHHFPRASKPD